MKFISSYLLKRTVNRAKTVETNRNWIYDKKRLATLLGGLTKNKKLMKILTEKSLITKKKYKD